MTMRKTATTFALTATAAGATLATASPVAAGGVGDFLSPAFGTSCTNHHGTRADGATTHGTGAVDGNLAGLPVGSPFNQCGGADMKPDLVVVGLLIEARPFVEVLNRV
ncbi:chaplin family protein [Streptomyces rectiviolaceus]